jgi:hypothetical protein
MIFKKCGLNLFLKCADHDSKNTKIQKYKNTKNQKSTIYNSNQQRKKQNSKSAV